MGCRTGSGVALLMPLVAALLLRLLLLMMLLLLWPAFLPGGGPKHVGPGGVDACMVVGTVLRMHTSIHVMV